MVRNTKGMHPFRDVPVLGNVSSPPSDPSHNVTVPDPNSRGRQISVFSPWMISTGCISVKVRKCYSWFKFPFSNSFLLHFIFFFKKLLVLIFNGIFIYLFCGEMGMPWHMYRAQKMTCGHWLSFSPSCGFWGSKLGCQASWQVPFPAEPSYQHSFHCLLGLSITKAQTLKINRTSWCSIWIPCRYRRIDCEEGKHRRPPAGPLFSE